MPLILITGISTSGKSTIAKELTKRGFEAYDTEHNGISAWFNKETNERAAEFGQIPERTKAWMDQHEWRMSMDWVKQKVKEADSKPVFLCGGGANEPEVRALCGKVIWLKTNEATIRARVNNPRDHTYGTQSHELERILEGNKRKEAEYLEYGAVMVDATLPTSEVVDEILSKTIDFAQVGQGSLRAFAQTIKKLAESNESFDIIAAAGDSGQLAARITEEVYRQSGKTIPPKLVAPIYRHADETETILFDNTILVSQFDDWKIKSLNRILFVDDEIGSGNAVRGMIDLLLKVSPDIQSVIIVAEDGGFNGPSEINGVKANFIATRKRMPGIYNAISYTVPWKFQKPLKDVLADEPDLNDKQVMCTLLGLPTKEFNGDRPEFNNRLIERAKEHLPNFYTLQKEYQKYFTEQLAELTAL